MTNKNSFHVAAQPMIWIESKDGNTYICPVGAVKDPRNPTDDELSLCVNESHNPQNN